MVVGQFDVGAALVAAHFNAVLLLGRHKGGPYVKLTHYRELKVRDWHAALVICCHLVSTFTGSVLDGQRDSFIKWDGFSADS